MTGNGEEGGALFAFASAFLCDMRTSPKKSDNAFSKQTVPASEDRSVLPWGRGWGYKGILPQHTHKRFTEPI